MENDLIQKSEKLHEELLRQLREEKSGEQAEAAPRSGRFEPLPGGTYIGGVYIIANTVEGETSPNRGLKKYEFQLTVAEGDQKGRMTYYHRVIMPHHFVIPPPGEDERGAEKRIAAAKLYAEQTERLLGICGVDTRERDAARFVEKIAANNRRKPVVNFNVKDGGQPYINYLVRHDVVADAALSLLEAQAVTLPDGNDLPL